MTDTMLSRCLFVLLLFIRRIGCRQEYFCFVVMNEIDVIFFSALCIFFTTIRNAKMQQVPENLCRKNVMNELFSEIFVAFFSI